MKHIEFSIASLRCVFLALLFSILAVGCAQSTPDEGTLIKTKSISGSANGDYRAFYLGVDTSKTNVALKLELHNRIKDHKVVFYTGAVSPEPSGYNFNSVGDQLLYLNTYTVAIPSGFDVWDAYIAYALKRITPMLTTCGQREITDWYKSACRKVPASGSGGSSNAAPRLFLSSGNSDDQDPGSGSNKYNREHSWPKSWFAAGTTAQNNPSGGSYCFNGNADSSDFANNNWDYRAYTDLVHVIPADRDANTQRSNNPYGIVSGAGTCGATCSPSKSGAPDIAAITPSTPTCLNGDETRVPCTATTVFEPPDAIKGDMARIYFYMATRYYQEDTCWNNVEAANKANIKKWQEDLLRKWHQNDPVDDTERARNDLIQRIQGNRNPFVDHPEWVSQIDDF